MTSTWVLIAECPAFTRVKPAISVCGLNPWDHSWISLDEPEIVVPDSKLTSRERWLRVYEIGDTQHRVRFAAYLRDNTVWNFYVPASPGDPDSLKATTAKYEGHWRKSVEEASTLPLPIPDPEWLGRTAFLNYLDTLEGAAERVVYRGKSLCRLCGCENGHEALRFRDWEWPAGYRHYIADHHVRPSEQFENFVAINACLAN
jgi:hypothetical protein